ncbi:MAG TPA: carboxypeptidase-like regulatory domain-containing protein, partial [Methanocella sp.]|nr:carboxypeptidase-like regulatory domain-containing protein [Methanocella sp.]
MRSGWILVLALGVVVFLAVSPGRAGSQSSSLLSGNIVVQGYVSKATGTSEVPGAVMPIAGAQIYFIRDNAIVANATSNPVGFYAVTLPAASGYTVAVSLSGFQTLITQADFLQTQSYSIQLTPIPFNGFVPYALYPVLET